MPSIGAASNTRSTYNSYMKYSKQKDNSKVFSSGSSFGNLATILAQAQVRIQELELEDEILASSKNSVIDEIESSKISKFSIKSSSESGR